MTGSATSAMRARLAASPARRRFAGRPPILSGFGVAHLVMALAALALALLAVPRFAAQAVLLPIAGDLDALQAGAPLMPDRLDKAGKMLALARRFDPWDGRLSSDLALTELLLAERGAPLERRALLETAIADLERGLAQSPANSFAWARLAGARLMHDGQVSPKMLAALRMSYVTGPYADKIMPFRASLTLSHWEALDPALLSFAKGELIYLWERRGSWEANQLPLITLLCETGRTGLLAATLIEAHRSLAEFDRLYPTHLSPDACAKAR
jgi:tetratricopeptide (TPR) repeat protein